MHTTKTMLTALTMLAATAAQAATDPGLTLHDTYASARRLGVGARASVTIPLSAATVRRQGPVLALQAGPSLTRSATMVHPRERSAVASFAALTLRPNHSIALTLAGQPLAVFYASSALREQAGREQARERRNLSTVAIVAIGVGAAAIVGGLLFIDAVNDASD